MAKRNRKKERLLAWIVFIFVILLMAGLIFVAVIKLKDPVVSKINELMPEKQEAEEEPAEEEPEMPEVEEQAMSEEDLDTIFDDVDESILDETPEEVVEEPEPQTDELLVEAKKVVDEMSIEEKVAQLFFIAPEALTGVDPTTAAGEKTRTCYNEYPVGGIIFFKKNIEDPDQLKEMTANLQKYSSEAVSLPLFLGIDEEGGRVARIADSDGFEVDKIGSMQSIGETGDESEAFTAGRTIGAYLRDYGFNIDFAPDADVITEEENKVIGDRSFGTDPELVSRMSCSYLEGLHEAGIFGCPKHYPGHGGTKEDSHEGKAVTDRTWNEMEEAEILPFRALVDDGVQFIMVSHISAPEVTGDEIPASVSGILITEKLRGEIVYNGIVITDAMGMGAISDNYDSKTAAVEALKAGADMILMPKDFKEAYDGVLEAISDGTLSEERIDESAVRIVKAKLVMGETEDDSEEDESEASEE